MTDGPFKENIQKYYNQEAELRDKKSVKPDWKVRVRENFCNLIKQENKHTLLELGAGAGYDSLFFMQNGFSVTAVDLSGEMVKKCKEKNIEAFELDFYHLSALNKKFDCIYAINTLLHVPQSDLPQVLKEILLTLDDDGLFFMGLYGGEDIETEWVNRDVSEASRFFAFHSEKTLKETLSHYFEILHFESFDIGTGTDIFHSIILRKK